MRFLPTKRRLKQLAIGLAIFIALALIANAFMAWRTEARLQAKIAAIRAAGAPASIADLAPKPIPADENAAAYLEKIAPRLDEFGKDHGRFFNTPIGKAYVESENRGEPPSVEQIAAIRAIVEKYPDVEAGLATAADCDQYASLADFTLNHQTFLQELFEERVWRARTAARFSAWQTKLLIADGEPQQAAEFGLKSLRLARLHDGEPLLINYLVGVALRAMAAQDLYEAMNAGPVSPQLHAAIDEELARHDDPQRFAEVLKTERAYSLALTASIGLDSSADHVNPIWLSMVGWPMKRFYLGALDSYDPRIATAPKSWEDVCRELGPPNMDPPSTGKGVLADLLLPSLKSAYVAQFRNLATLRAIRIFNALAAYRDKHGHEASGLSDLSLPKEATIDPFSGEPLKLKHTDDGWIIYSVMQNGVDDGGDFHDLKDYGVAPRKWRAAE